MFLEIQERLKLLQSRFLGSSNEESRELAIISDAETSVPIAPTTEEDREASGERRRHNVDSYFLVPERLEGGHGESSSSLVPHHSIARQAHEYPPDYEQASSPAKDVSGNETE